MIDVDFLYKKIQDVLIENQGGYFSNDEFNRDLALAQNDLLTFLVPSTNSKVSDLLQPFIVEYETSSDNFALPSGYYMRLDCSVEFFFNTSGGVEKVLIPAIELNTDDEYSMLYSPVRKPNVLTGTAAFVIRGGMVYVFPPGNKVYFKYIRLPVEAKRAVILDNVNEVENYDSANTVHLEWPEQALNYFVDLLSYYRGIESRETEIIRWLSAKQVKHDERNVSRTTAN